MLSVQIRERVAVKIRPGLFWFLRFQMGQICLICRRLFLRRVVRADAIRISVAFNLEYLAPSIKLWTRTNPTAEAVGGILADYRFWAGLTTYSISTRIDFARASMAKASS
jgi:hypothetical protein